MSLRHGTGHLSDQLSEYAGRRLPDDRALQWDRHLVACETCRAAVEVERRLQAVLTAGPSMPPSLRTTLIAIGSPGPVAALLAATQGTEGRGAPLVPEVPRVPVGLTLPVAYSLPTVRPASPALHRSPLRSAVMATVVAGASAAAAWGLAATAGATGVAVNGIARPTTTTTTTTTTRTFRSISPGGLGAQIGSTTAAVPSPALWTAEMAGLGGSATDPAQSTP